MTNRHRNMVSSLNGESNRMNNFAISSTGIGTALQKSASAMASANNTLDESIALITAGNNVVQDPDAVGTALKTVSLRLRSTSADIEAMGEDADGAAKTVSNLRDLLLGLTKNKVDIQIDKDTYASTYEIMLKMSKVWGDMTDMQQASALEAMFGKRQANIGASILNNMSDAEKALTTSLESSGSAMREQEAYTKGIQYSIDKLKASLQELSTVSLDSSTIKFFVDFVNGAVNASTAVGGLVPVLSTLAVLFLSFTRNEKFGFLQTFIANLFETQIVAGTATVAIGGLTISIKALTGILTGGLLLALPLIVKGLDSIITTSAEYSEKVEEASSAYETAKTNLESINTELDSQTKLMDDLLAKDNLTYADKSELENLKLITDELKIQQDLALKDVELTKKQQAISASNLVNKKYGKYEVSNNKINQYESGAESTGNNAALITNDNDLSSMLAGLRQFVELREEALGSGATGDYEHFKDLTDEITDSIWKNATELEEQKSNMEEYYNVIKNIPYSRMTSEQKKVYDSYNSISEAIKIIYSELDPNKWKDIQFSTIFDDKSFSDAKTKLEELAKTGELTEKTISSNNEYQKLISETGLTASEVVEQIYALTNGIDENGNVITDTTEKLSAMNDAIKQLSTVSDALDSLDSAFAKLTSKEGLDFSNLSSLQKYLGDTEGFDDFIRVAGTATSVTKEVQDVFDNLIGKYLNTSGILEGLTQDNKDLVTSQLEQMGVSNAEVIVNDVLAKQLAETTSKEEALALEKDFVKEKGKDLESATYDEINAFLGEQNASDDTRQALYQLTLEKINLNDNQINTASDITQIISLANAADASAVSLAKLQNIKDTLNGKYKSSAGGSAGLSAIDQALSDKTAVENGTFDYYQGKKLNANDYIKPVYSGGDATKSASGKLAKSKSGTSAKAFTGAIDNSLHSIDKLETKISEFKKTMDDSDPYSVQIKDINSLIKLQDKLAKGYDKQANTYKSKFVSATKGLNASYVNQIKNGTKFNIQSFNGNEKLYNKVTAAQDWYEKWQKSLIDAKDTKREITESKSEVVKLKIEADFEKFDKQLKKKTDVLSEVDLALDLTKDGSVEQLTLLQTGYKLASEKAKLLSDEIAKLNKQYAQGKIDETTYAERLDDLSGQLGSSVSSIQSYRDSIISYMRDYYDDKKELIENSQKDELDALEKTHKKTIDNLNEQIDKFREIVEAKKKSLQATEDEYQYQKKLKENTDSVSKIQSQISELEPAVQQKDREAIQKKRELEDQLAEAKQALTDTQHDYEVDSALDAQDKALDSFEDMMNDKIDLADRFYDSEVERINSQYNTELTNLKNRYATEEQLILEAADLTKQSFGEAWNSISELMKSNFLTMSDGFKGAVTSSNPSSFSNNPMSSIGIGASLTVGNTSPAIKTVLQNANGTGQGSSELNQYVMSKGYGVLSYNNMSALATLLGLNISAKDARDEDNQRKILAKLKAAGFRDTGMVSASNTSGLRKLIGEDGIIAARNKEIVLDELDSQTFMKFVPTMNNFMKQFKPNLPDFSKVTNNNLSPVVNVTIPIAGNADSSTVRKLDQSANSIAKQTAQEIIKIVRTK